MERWYKPEWHEIERLPTYELNLNELREVLTKSVKERLMTDVPFGLLISGGVDSSIIAAIAVRLYNQRNKEKNIKEPPKLHSFCIGLEGSPDIC